MKKITFVLLLISFIGFGQTEDEKAVRNCFSKYKKAILESKGAIAAQHIDKNTVKYYQRILDKSIYADSLSLAKSNILDRMTVLSSRHRIKEDELLKMTPKSYFTYAIDQGMIGKNGVMNVSLGEVKTEGDFATAKILSGGKSTPMTFQFNKENGEWKLDLTSIFKISAMALKKFLSESETSETEFILNALSVIIGEAPSEKIWQPIREKK